jgi:hypothetical protein
MRKLGTSLLAVAWLLMASRVSAAENGSPAPEAEPDNGTIALAYAIGFWGIPFGFTDYSGRFTGNGYSARSHFQTSGIVSLFWQATIDATAKGQFSEHTLTPDEYDSLYSRGSSRKERVKISFGRDEPLTVADPPYDTTKFPVTTEEKREAVDPMSAVTLVLAGMKADTADPCGTVAPVFDGRRRYDISFSYLNDEPVTLDNGLFAGTAHLCQLHYRQIAGFKPKIVKEGAALPPIFADFADIPAAGAPNGHYVVALRLWSRLSWGTVSATLTALRVPPVQKTEARHGQSNNG